MVAFYKVYAWALQKPMEGRFLTVNYRWRSVIWISCKPL